MDTNYQDKDRVIEYLSVIRDAEVNKPPQELDEELIEACVGLLLYLQDKNAELTPEQINEAVEKIPFVDTEKVVKPKNKNKKINKFKLLLIAAIIPIILTILTIMAMADIDWLHFDTLKEMFQSVASAPAGEIFHKDDTDFGRVDGNIFSSPEEFARKYDLNILVPGKNFTKCKLAYIAYMPYTTGDEIEISFEKAGLYYRIYTYDVLEQEIKNLPFTQKDINGLSCYILNLSDVGLYQVYFNHNGYTYRINHSDLDVIIELIENMEEIK